MPDNEFAKIGFDPLQMELAMVYKIMAGCIVPRPIAFVSTISRASVINAAPFSFFNVLSHIPPLIGISISKIYKTGTNKDTLTNIVEGRDFVINIVNNDIVRAQDLCSNAYPPEVDELALSGLTAVPSKIVRAPRVEESPVNFECALTQVMPLDDSPYTLVIGRIVYMHVRADLLQPRGNIDLKRLDAVGRMAGKVYARTQELFALDHDSFQVVAESAPETIADRKLSGRD